MRGSLSSHPSRVRGLKRRLHAAALGHHRSHPSRVRGLKQHGQRADGDPRRVAPLAGAWIETGMGMKLTASQQVAPLAGAWIETKPMRRCRLSDSVAPLAGAWIETHYDYTADGFTEWSHPSRVRGLKRSCLNSFFDWLASHPSRVRGLKPPRSRPEPAARRVAPLAGAWIETMQALCRALSIAVAPLAGAWIETSCRCRCRRRRASHPSRVRGLKRRFKRYSAKI